MFNHSKWPNKLSEAGSDPAKKEELARHCSSDTNDALLSCKEVNTCLYVCMMSLGILSYIIKEWTNTMSDVRPFIFGMHAVGRGQR